MLSVGKGKARSMKFDWNSPRGEALKAKMRAERTGRPNPKNLGHRGPGRTKPGRIVYGGQIARELTSGNSPLEAATNLKMNSVRTLSMRAEDYKLNFGKNGYVCDQGEPFRHRHLNAIREATDYHQAAFERAVGLKHHAATAQNGSEEATRRPEIARAVLGWRDRAILIMIQAEGDRNRRYRNHEIIHTFLPELASLYDALKKTFEGIRAELCEHPDSRIDDIWNFTAERSRENHNAGAWYRTLLYLWEIESFLETRLDQLRETDSIADFIREILGERYGVHQQQIKLAMQEDTCTIRPAEMFGIVVSALAEAPEPEKRGADDGPRGETRKYIKLAGAIQKVCKHQERELVWSDHAERICPDNPGNIHQFVRRHRVRIVYEAGAMRLAEAEVLIRAT